MLGGFIVGFFVIKYLGFIYLFFRRFFLWEVVKIYVFFEIKEGEIIYNLLDCIIFI